MPAIDLSAVQYDPLNPVIAGAPVSERRLSDLQGYFADTAAFEQALAMDDPVLYRVYSLEPGTGEGDLAYGFGVLMPGKVGQEYYFTKGHYHAWRAAAEVYIGLSGSGYMLLEDEQTGASRLLPLTGHSAVYVPGGTAHRTINTGTTPLTYIGINPARAGHDYGSIAERGFRQIVVEVAGTPTLIDRALYAASGRPA
ncbi:MAG: glucose-6-phosphate isomerase [Anaerolineae bacterium]|jgi:glucose-6-phosphate isomerase|nr:glucose-6-phosphate isomerase [Anaerolineae bacterium]